MYCLGQWFHPLCPCRKPKILSVIFRATIRAPLLGPYLVNFGLEAPPRLGRSGRSPPLVPWGPPLVPRGPPLALFFGFRSVFGVRFGSVPALGCSVVPGAWRALSVIFCGMESEATFRVHRRAPTGMEVELQPTASGL